MLTVLYDILFYILERKRFRGSYYTPKLGPNTQFSLS